MICAPLPQGPPHAVTNTSVRPTICIIVAYVVRKPRNQVFGESAVRQISEEVGRLDTWDLGPGALK